MSNYKHFRNIPCKFFALNGTCTRGNNCKFSHKHTEITAALYNYRIKEQEMKIKEKKMLEEIELLKNNITSLTESIKQNIKKKEEEKNDNKSNSKMIALKEECSRLDDEVEKLNSEIFQNNCVIDRLRQDIHKADQKIENLTKENKELLLTTDKKYKELEDKYKTSTENEKKLKSELDNTNDLLKSKIKEFDEYQSFVKLISEIDAKIGENEKKKEIKDDTEVPLVFFAGIDKISEENDEKNDNSNKEVKYYENMIIEARKLLKSETKDDKPEFTEQIVWSFDGDMGKEQYSSILQAELEKFYAKKVSTVGIISNGYNYTVNFGTMIQQNDTTKKNRKIYRVVIKIPVPKPIKFGNKILRPFEIKVVDEKSTEFDNLKTNFLTLKHPLKDSMSHCVKIDNIYGTQYNQKAKIVKIEKFYNDTMELMYETKKGIMKNKSELVLYHGTRSVDYLQPARQGLDFRLGAANTYFGKAIYLSLYPRYSHDGYPHKLANGNYVMLVVKCIVGNSKTYTINYDSSLTRPPVFTGNELYDSVNMNIDGTHMYCVYDNSQCLVTHAIHYSI